MDTEPPAKPPLDKIDTENENTVGIDVGVLKYANRTDGVGVESLDVKGMLESPRNSRNTASSAWNTFTDMLESMCERESTHFVEVEPEGTIKECAKSGVETEKPLWVREHSWPACGFRPDRDTNAAWNILSRGLTHLKVGHSEATSSESRNDSDVRTRASLLSTRVETAVVSAKRVVETGSPCLKDPPKMASRQGRVVHTDHELLIASSATQVSKQIYDLRLIYLRVDPKLNFLCV
ncbi:MAG: transposase [Haloquadratum sp. J07HQX50]|jgi:Transposase and inactivated derivatives|nr:MAG: transposase [Haloquadratum sp. J07HQX50]